MAEMSKSEIWQELRNVTMKMQQLVERKKRMVIMRELLKRVDCNSLEGEDCEENEQELSNIDEKLKQLEVIRAELQRRHDQAEVSPSVYKMPDPRPVVEPSDISTLSPPNYPAPVVTEDYANLQFTPTKTRCPNCSSFITTETYTSVSSITWLVCMSTAMMGCVAGCCFIPFCLDSFKSTSHKCPKCNSLIATIKKL
ncbi:unnamed protein product [Knipowitschia caucasica]